MNNLILPAEWEKQAAVQLTWPHEDGCWGSSLSTVENTFLEIASTISCYQPVLIVVHSLAEQQRLQELLKCNSAKHWRKQAAQAFLSDDRSSAKVKIEANPANFIFAIAPSNDVWARDHAALTVRKDNCLQFAKFRFNGWGDKFPANLDNAIHQQLLTQNGLSQIFSLSSWQNTKQFLGQSLKQTTAKQLVPETQFFDYVLEGGSVESNGKGLLLTTSSCLLNPNRHNHQRLQSKTFDQAAHKTWTEEEILSKALGAKKTFWLDSGLILGDDTDGHVDTLARFCSEERIAYVSTEHSREKYFSCQHLSSSSIGFTTSKTKTTKEQDLLTKQFFQLKQMEEQLQGFRDLAGKPLKLTPLPEPQQQFWDEGKPLPATYANFLIINQAVLLPVYGDANDGLAQEVLQDCFPQRTIIPINCLNIVKQNGSLHCLTMQYPAA